jgi:hypothetical protein
VRGDLRGVRERGEWIDAVALAGDGPTAAALSGGARRRRRQNQRKRRRKTAALLGLLKGSSALLAMLEDARGRGGDRELVGTAWKQPQHLAGAHTGRWPIAIGAATVAPPHNTEP